MQSLTLVTFLMSKKILFLFLWMDGQMASWSLHRPMLFQVSQKLTKHKMSLTDLAKSPVNQRREFCPTRVEPGHSPESQRTHASTTWMLSSTCSQKKHTIPKNTNASHLNVIFNLWSTAQTPENSHINHPNCYLQTVFKCSKPWQHKHQSLNTTIFKIKK